MMRHGLRLACVAVLLLGALAGADTVWKSGVSVKAHERDPGEHITCISEYDDGRIVYGDHPDCQEMVREHKKRRPPLQFRVLCRQLVPGTFCRSDKTGDDACGWEERICEWKEIE